MAGSGPSLLQVWPVDQLQQCHPGLGRMQMTLERKGGKVPIWFVRHHLDPLESEPAP